MVQLPVLGMGMLSILFSLQCSLVCESSCEIDFTVSTDIQGSTTEKRSPFIPGPDEETRMALEYMQPAWGETVMDLSCGSGLFSRRFIKSGDFLYEIQCAVLLALVWDWFLRAQIGM